MTSTLQALSLVEKAEPVRARFILRLRDHRSMWMQDGCKVYMDSYVASNGSCSMVTWTIFKPPLGGRFNTKPGDHGTPNAHKPLIYFILCYHVWGLAWIEIHWNNIWLRAKHIWLHTTLEVLWPHYMILDVSWDDLWALAFELSQFHGHGSWLVCEEVALSMEVVWCYVVLNSQPSENVNF